MTVSPNDKRLLSAHRSSTTLFAKAMRNPEMASPSSFYVQAIYDYHAIDDSTLSFAWGDIIEVLTQLESGWWDGLMGAERGWFPSNFVKGVSEQEAKDKLEIHSDNQAGFQLPKS